MTARLPTLLLTAAIALQGVPARASDFATGAIGTTGSELLNVDVGARGMAMGGAYCSATNDASSLYWNPAGLAQIPRISATFMHNRYIADINFDYLAYAQRVSETAVAGGAFRYMDAGSIASTDANGLSNGYFHPRSYVAEFGYGQHIIDLTDSERDISLGVTGRWLHSDMVAQADAMAGDVGIQAHYYGAYWPWHFGAMAQNFGKGQKFDYTRDALPFHGRLGSSISPTRFLLFSLEAVFPITDQPHIAFGAEVTLEAHKEIQGFLRAGMDTLNLGNDLQGFRAATFGFGIKTAQLTFDYAFAPMGFLGDVHRFSVSYNLPAKGSRRYRER